MKCPGGGSGTSWGVMARQGVSEPKRGEGDPAFCLKTHCVFNKTTPKRSLSGFWVRGREVFTHPKGGTSPWPRPGQLFPSRNGVGARLQPKWLQKSTPKNYDFFALFFHGFWYHFGVISCPFWPHFGTFFLSKFLLIFGVHFLVVLGRFRPPISCHFGVENRPRRAPDAKTSTFDFKQPSQ